MKHPVDVSDDNSVKHFDYHLPDECIAQFPLDERSAAKMLVWRTGTVAIDDHSVGDIAELLDPSSMVILNNSKVIPARLHFQKSSSSPVELFLIEPMEGDHAAALAQKHACRWFCLFGAKRLKMPARVSCPSSIGTVTADLLQRQRQGAIVEFRWEADLSFGEVLQVIGNIPIPPYMNRADTAMDKDRYQTVFARYEGSVAAPTAALHFNDEMLNALERKGITRVELSLHVGLGTFQPMKSDTISEHSMHEEIIDIPKQSLIDIAEYLERTENSSGDARFVCVGTTSLRSIESLYWLARTFKSASMSKGIKFIPEHTIVEQWCWKDFSMSSDPTPIEAVRMLLNMDWEGKSNLRFRSALMISPGYPFRFCNTLMTNFHQPQSTLLVLVSAFCGDKERVRIYEHALQSDYRFLSYGDSSLLFR